MNDLRHILRTLFQSVPSGGSKGGRDSPGFAAVTVATLALGIGAVTAIFTVISGVLLEPLPYGEPDRIVEMESRDPDIPDRPSAFSEPEFAAYFAQQTSLAALAAYRGRPLTLTGEGEPQQLWCGWVTADYFAVMGREPFLGRALTAADDRPGAAGTVVLTHELWSGRFAADPEIIGRRLTLDGEVYTVIGVMPPRFGGDSIELFAPLRIDFADARRGRHYLFARARLAPGVELAKAESELKAIAARLTAERSGSPRGDSGGITQSEPATVRLVPLQERIAGNVRPALLMLYGAVVLLLLIACVNVAGLYLARLAARDREVAIRVALGAGRLNLLRRFLAESLVLAGLGGALGVLFAYWGTRVLVELAGSAIPRAGEIGLDVRVLVFAALVTLGTGVVFGLLPMRGLRRFDLTRALRDGAHGQTAGRERSRLRFMLVTVEVALAVVLLIGAGLLLRSFMALQAVDKGFDGNGVLLAHFVLPSAKYGEGERQIAFYNQLFERLSHLPGVEATGAAFPLPISGGGIYRLFGIYGREASGAVPSSAASWVSPSFFRTLGMNVTRGRAFTHDDHAAAPGVVVINEAAARKFFAGEEALGQRLTFDPPDAEETTWWTIVGVVADVKQNGLDAEAPPMLYHSYFQIPFRTATVALRAADDPRALVAPLRRELRALDPDLPLTHVRTVEEMIGASLERPRFNTVLLGVFAGLALVLATVGVYALLAYSVSESRQEIGIRMALGARRGALVGYFVRRGMAPVVLGLVIGVGLALLSTRLLASLLFAVEATDPGTFAGVLVVLAAVALVGCWIPARRAAEVDAMVVLREE